MNLTLDVTDQFLEDIFANYPEYACYSIRCEGYNYKNFVFKFKDSENDEQYVVDRQKAKEGFQKFAQAVLGGKLPGLHIKAANLLDAGAYDAYSMDAVLQMCVLGEIIYG